MSGAFEAFFQRWASAQPGGLPRCEHDPDFVSRCETGEVDKDGTVAWRLVRRPFPADLTKLAKAYGNALPNAVTEFLATAFFGCIETRLRVDGQSVPVLMCSIWNEAEFSRALDQGCAGLEVSRAETGRSMLTIATTCDDRFFAVSLDSGLVTLEDFGRPPIVVAPSLEAFYDSLGR